MYSKKRQQPLPQMPVSQFDATNNIQEATSYRPQRPLDSTADAKNSSTKVKPHHHSGSKSSQKHSRHRPSIASLLDEVRSRSQRNDILEYETRRADEAIARAEYAEVRLKEAFTRLNEAEEARAGSEIHSLSVEEDLHRHKDQLTRVQQELDDARVKMRNLQEDKLVSERETEKIRTEHHELQSRYRTQLAREQGREEGLKRGMAKQFHENRQYIYEAGFSDGFEEGRESGLKEGIKKGRKEGVAEGKAQGRREERRNALEAFDRFIQEQREDEEETSSWTRRWTESVYYTNS